MDVDAVERGQEEEQDADKARAAAEVIDARLRGVVAELLQEAAADQPRSSGHRVGRGDPAGTVTAVLAQSVTLLGPHDRKLAITPESVAMERAGDEAVEGMYLQTDGSAQPQ